MKTLLIRTLTALVLGAVAVAGLWWSVYTYLAIILVAMGLCISEIQSLLRPLYAYTDKQARRNTVWLIILASIFFMGSGLISRFPEWSRYGSLLGVIPFLLYLPELFLQGEKPFQHIAYNMLTLLYIAGPFALLNLFIIQGPEYIPELLLGILILIWTYDTFAYFGGSLLGRHTLWKAISPKKTWEGVIIGALAAIAGAWIISQYFLQIKPENWLVVSGLIVIFGTVGDLLESMLKRRAGVKDSSRLLPGHGGMLDRLDAVLFSLPFILAYISTT